MGLTDLVSEGRDEGRHLCISASLWGPRLQLFPWGAVPGNVISYAGPSNALNEIDFKVLRQRNFTVFLRRVQVANAVSLLMGDIHIPDLGSEVPSYLEVLNTN